MAAGITDFGDFGARGCYRDRGCYRRNPISRRLRLPHPATGMNLLSAADLRLAELCSHLRRGLSSIQTRGDAAFRRVSLAGLDACAGRQSNRRARCASVFIRRVTTAGTDNSERKPAATHGACECRPPGRCGDCGWRQESLAGRTPTSSRRLAHFRMEDAHVLDLPLSF
eukprot:CAMPEP_0181182908 /NCGR_PEP_ID=MMETSP1096-20121128/8136_1 /TAXON_ID=156174 ORGANISM="Chrysochromulina ericina, Strain CCMP281" /NCGR_SAMPLE_ID=MMETSP1096 /ASSEMBLY_ACC=CAM_ASM_000453 /LENGTH=168 /DNA_ID=CAMNT_0023271539 /DNA_START=1304 /DNA_END=1807 /DNA_ORIENTATION=-